jgi:uncharacterized protein GlcG (DUF336 family)
MRRVAFPTLIVIAGAALSLPAQTTDKPPVKLLTTVQRHSISMEAALAIARVALKAGTDNGTDVAVVVVDNAGIPLVLLRADNGTEQFVEGATQKAWTAVNFRASTRELFEDIKRGKEDFSQLSHVPKALFLMGGVPLKDGLRIVGAIGVAGAVSGIEDDVIARRAADEYTQLLKK